jgi:Diguanylate cyclase, GGDEF domain
MLRPSDLLARIGGEEFGLILPTATMDQAVEIVDRLRAATPLGESFSARVALWDGDETSDQIVARADHALYQAKQAGRNRVLPASTRPGTAKNGGCASPPPTGRRPDPDPGRRRAQNGVDPLATVVAATADEFETRPAHASRPMAARRARLVAFAVARR